MKRCGRMRSCILRNFVFSHIVPPVCCLSHRSRSKKWGHDWGRSKMTTSWCSGCNPHGLAENDSHVLPKNDTLCCDVSYTRAFISSQFSLCQACIFCDRIPLSQVGYANGNHFGSRLATRFRRPTGRNGYTTSESSAW